MNVTISESPHPIIQARRAQMIPTLAPADVDRLRRFGETRSYRSGERIIRAGNVAPGLIVILSGKMCQKPRRSQRARAGLRSAYIRLVFPVPCRSIKGRARERRETKQLSGPPQPLGP
jgi:hypothetical protein